ncbi:MAG: WcaF family extracellular polysaccharide biosynthesis acetyltransferase [Candidatus Neomarinimicrobiota bacterium]
MTQDLRSFKVPRDFRGRSNIVVQLWRLVHPTLFRFSPRIFDAWRRFLLRLFGARIGKGVIIRPSVKILYPWNLEISDWSWIGEYVTLYNMAMVTIGDNTVISQHSYICAGNHDYTKTSFDIFSEPIKIAGSVWIAADVFVAPGVSIQENAVVTARSTVKTDLPGDMICEGNPARPIQPRRKE